MDEAEAEARARASLRAAQQNAAVQQDVLTAANRAHRNAYDALVRAQAEVALFDSTAEDSSVDAVAAFRAGASDADLPAVVAEDAAAARRAELRVRMLVRACETLAGEVVRQELKVAACKVAVEKAAAVILALQASAMAVELNTLEGRAMAMRWSLDALTCSWAMGKPIALSEHTMRVLNVERDKNDYAAQPRRLAWQKWLADLSVDACAQPDPCTMTLPGDQPVAVWSPPSVRWEDRPAEAKRFDPSPAP